MMLWFVVLPTYCSGSSSMVCDLSFLLVGRRRCCMGTLWRYIRLSVVKNAKRNWPDVVFLSIS
jgi:hypothetical protein